MNCTTIYCTTPHFISQHNTVVLFKSLKCTAQYYTALHNTAVDCTILQCTKQHCSGLYHTTLHYITLQWTVQYYTAPNSTAVDCTILHCTTQHCSAVHCWTILHYSRPLEWKVWAGATKMQSLHLKCRTDVGQRGCANYVLHCTALHIIALQRTVLLRIALHWPQLHGYLFINVHCTVLQVNNQSFIQHI